MGVKQILYIILFVLPVFSIAQDSTRISVHTFELNTGEPLPSQRVQLSFQDSVFLDTVTNENGVLELIFLSSRFVEESEVGIGVVFQGAKTVNDWSIIEWKSNYDFYQEIYFTKLREVCRTPLPFLFKENSSKPIADSLEETYNMYLEILELNPEIVFSINAYFNFYENNEIQMQRAKQIKKGFIERGVDPERLVINVKKESDYRKYYNSFDSEVIPMDESFAENASKEELDYMKSQYQSVRISIDSWK